ncbi:MAG: hypothetical protein JWN21_1985 [Sphingomonas bacterium]|nr:hypothetical protein [Sphingomonas bacterium]
MDTDSYRAGERPSDKLFSAVQHWCVWIDSVKGPPADVQTALDGS